MNKTSAIENPNTIETSKTMENSKVIENAKALQNKKEDKKSIKKFVLIMLLCFVGGMIGGFASAVLGDANLGFGEFLLGLLSAIAPFGNVVLTTILLIIDTIIIRKCRKEFALWDGENEEWIDKIELRLSYAMIFVSIHSVLTYFFMATGLYFVDFDDLSNIMTIIRLVFAFVGIFYSLFVITILQKQTVNLVKEINPEKKGSVFDFNFQKKWMDSCDESERYQIYQASFKSFQITNYACIGVWLFCFIGMISWEFGLLPITMVSVIWMVSILSYQIECLRLSKHK